MDDYIHQTDMCRTYSMYTHLPPKNEAVSQEGYVNRINEVTSKSNKKLSKLRSYAKVTHLVSPYVTVHQLGIQRLPVLCALLT